VDIPAQPPPTRLNGSHNETGPPAVFKGLGQHFRAVIGANHVKTRLEETNGTEPSSGGHVQDLPDPTLFEDVVKKNPPHW